MSTSRAAAILLAMSVTATSLFVAACNPAPKPSANGAAPVLQVPSAYRDTYTYLGTWAVAADDAQGSKELHVVYASPGSVVEYRRLGKMPEGALLVKEVFDATTEPMTTGVVSRESTLKGWFVMRKASEAEPYTNDKLWGDGWGWAWFNADSPMRTTTMDYEQECKGCHIPAAKTDWIYADGYPPLKSQ